MLHCRQTGTVNIHPRFVLQFVCLSVRHFKIGHGESNCRIRMKNAARVILYFHHLWCEVQVSVFTMVLHGPVRDDPGPGLIIFMEQRRPVRLIVFYWREPVGEICLIKRSDARSDINHGKVKTPARSCAGKEVGLGSQ